MLIGTLFRVLKANWGTIGAAVGMFYLGTQSSHVVKRAEHNLLRSHLEFTSESHRGSLDIVDAENSHGQLEKKLKNLETGDLVYTIRTDYLPDNDFIYNGLARRAKSSDQAELKKMHEYSRHLEAALEDKLYSGMPIGKESVNPLELEIRVMPNPDGEIEAVLSYGDRAVILTKDDFDYLAKNGKQLSQEAGLNHVQNGGIGFNAGTPGPSEQGSNTYLYLGILAILAIAVRAYRKARAKYPVRTVS